MSSTGLSVSGPQRGRTCQVWPVTCPGHTLGEAESHQTRPIPWRRFGAIGGQGTRVVEKTRPVASQHAARQKAGRESGCSGRGSGLPEHVSGGISQRSGRTRLGSGRRSALAHQGQVGPDPDPEVRRIPEPTASRAGGCLASSRHCAAGVAHGDYDGLGAGR